MAKATFHKNQRVFVKPVGTWAVVEQVVPHWVKGLEEPLKIHYDVGLGREFAASELVAETSEETGDEELLFQTWRVHRLKNRWRDGDGAPGQPQPGTYPVVVTDEKDWGGWRVPIAEYDRDPAKIEFQAKIIESAPALMQTAKTLAKLGAEYSDELPSSVLDAAKFAASVLRKIYQSPAHFAPANHAAE
ncbi:MAG: hypothetical protein R3C52_05165 [Hyphomonadaceae bacterium]